MSVDSALGAVVAPQQRGRLAPSPGAAAAGLTDDALARSVAVLPGRLTTYESILRPLAPKKDKRCGWLQHRPHLALMYQQHSRTHVDVAWGTRRWFLTGRL